MNSRLRLLKAFLTIAAGFLVSLQVGCGDGGPATAPKAESGESADATEANVSFPTRPGEAFWLEDEEKLVGMRRLAPGESQEYDVTVGDGPVLPFIGVRVDLPADEMGKLQSTVVDGNSQPSARIEQLDPVDGKETLIQGPAGGAIIPRTINGTAKIRVTNLLDHPLSVQVYTNPDGLTAQHGHEKTGVFNPQAYRDSQK